MFSRRPPAPAPAEPNVAATMRRKPPVRVKGRRPPPTRPTSEFASIRDRLLSSRRSPAPSPGDYGSGDY